MCDAGYYLCTIYYGKYLFIVIRSINFYHVHYPIRLLHQKEREIQWLHVSVVMRKKKCEEKKKLPQRNQTMSFQDLVGFLSLYLHLILFVLGHS